jgi:hypothetical protein
MPYRGKPNQLRARESEGERGRVSERQRERRRDGEKKKGSVH